MKKTPVKRWMMPSTSRPGVTYVVSLWEDHSLSCTCPGWCKRVAKDGSRTCLHVTGVALSEALATNQKSVRIHIDVPLPTAASTILPGKTKRRIIVED